MSHGSTAQAARLPRDAVALVTGASSGFGLLASVELARRGLRVFASMRDLARRDHLRAAARDAGVADRVADIQLDVTCPASIDRALHTIATGAGIAAQHTAPATPASPAIDVLVNNAGFGMAGFIEDLSMDELREQFETNFFGLVALTKRVIPGMRARRRGRIINVSSMAGKLAQPGFGAYAASKFAVEGVSEALRHELLPHGVFVVLVQPGAFRTDIFTRNRRVGARALHPASPNYAAARRIEAIQGRLARRLADPIAVARVIADAATCARPRLRYLVGRDARAISAVYAAVPFGMWERAVARLLRARRPAPPSTARTGRDTR